MEQNTQTTGTNTATTQAPATTAPATTTASPQSMAERIAGYRATPGQFDDSPRPPKVQEPNAEQVEAAKAAELAKTNPEELFDKIIKDENYAPSDIKSEAGKANWKLLRAKAKERNEFESKLKTATEEIEKLKNAPKVPGDPAELEALKKERDLLSDRLKELDVERHPKFQTYFDNKTNAVLAEAKKVGGTEFGDKIANLLKLPDSEYRTAQLGEILSQLPPLNQGRLVKVLSDMEAVQSEKGVELAKARENYDKIQKAEREQAQKSQQEQRAKIDQALDRQIAEAQKAIPLFQKRDGDDKWNKSVDDRLNNARNSLKNGLDEESLARALIWAQVAPEILQDALAKAQDISSLQKELSSFKSATPKPGSGESPNPAPTIPAKLNLMDRIVWQAEQAGAVR